MAMSWEDPDQPIFPHCDQRVLHAPGECEYCDKSPLLQNIRKAWGINFTGYHETKGEYNTVMLPCPSEANRPLEVINMWDGNAPMINDSINNESAVYPPNAGIIHDLETRHVHVETAAIKCPCCRPDPELDAVALQHDTQYDETIRQIDRVIEKIKQNLDNLGTIVKGLVR